MNVTIYPPHRLDWKNSETDEDIRDQYSIFLAGTIDMGNSIDWQKQITEELSKEFSNLTFYNPRRLDWNSDWQQTLEEPAFVEQVNWELDMLNEADLIIMYFLPNSKSPITMLELGMHVANTNIVVYCPTCFWRKGNIEIVCERFQINYFDDHSKLMNYVKKTIAKKNEKGFA